MYSTLAREQGLSDFAVVELRLKPVSTGNRSGYWLSGQNLRADSSKLGPFRIHFGAILVELLFADDVLLAQLKVPVVISRSEFKLRFRKRFDLFVRCLGVARLLCLCLSLMKLGL